MESVLSLLFWVGLLFLLMRFGCGSHLFSHGHAAKSHKGTSAAGHGGSGGTSGGTHPRETDGSERLTWEAPEKDIDPVCGETVSTAEARPSLHDGQVYYFCSRECREAFEAAPEHYVGLGETHNVRRLDHTPAKGGSHG